MKNKFISLIIVLLASCSSVNNNYLKRGIALTSSELQNKEETEKNTTKPLSILNPEKRNRILSGLFDSHVHYFTDDFFEHRFRVNDEEPITFEDELDIYFKTFNGVSILISQAYMVEDLDSVWGKPSSRDEYNQRTSEAVQKFPKKLVGACALNHTWDDSAIVLRKCLAMPGMLGAKLYLDSGEPIYHIFRDVIYSNVINAIEYNKKEMKFLITHIANEAYWVEHYSDTPTPIDPAKKRDIRGVRKFLSIVESFPNIQFILAHALYSTHSLEALVEHYPNGLPGNLWLDISAVFDDEDARSEDDKSNMAILMKRAGVNHLLYGSDPLIGAGRRDLKEKLNRSVNSFLSRSEFSEEDKRDVLFTNGQNFLKKIGKL